MTNVRKINHKSDFDFILVVKDSQGNDVGFPDYDFSGSVSVGEPCKATSRKFPFSRKGDTLVNCFNDNGKIHIVCNDHHLSKGQLWVELKAEVPNGIYSDGSELIVIPQQIGIELVCEKGDIPTDVDSEFVVPFIYTSAYEMAKRAGYDGTEEEYADFTNRLPSVVKSAEQAVTDASQALQKAEEAAQELGATIEKANLAADAALQNASIAADSADIAKQSANNADAAAAAAMTAAGNAENAANEANETKKAVQEINERIGANENSRVEAETERVNSEIKRLSEEEKRVADENKRVAAENERVQNEENRIKEFETFKDDYIQKPNGGIDGQVLTKHGDTVVWSDVINKDLSNNKDLFIDIWNACCQGYGKYNSETELFELNGLTDITYQEAINIYLCYFASFTLEKNKNIYRNKVRTVFPIPTNYTSSTNCSQLFENCNELKVVRFITYWRDSGTGLFSNCSKLETIYGTIESVKDGGSWFSNCNSLRNINMLTKVNVVDLRSCSLITYTSIKYTVDNNHTVTTNPITIKVHSNIYNALTGSAAYPFNGGTQEQWQQLLIDATEKQITFATA